MKINDWYWYWGFVTGLICFDLAMLFWSITLWI